MNKFQLADIVNGAFGDAFNSLEDAEKALALEIEEGKRLNKIESGCDLGSDGSSVEDFFSIVEV